MLSKRILTMQDLSCVGQCSLTVALPVLSAYGIEAAVLPTAVLSNHTMFRTWSYLDLAPEMDNILKGWKDNGFLFDGFLLGYLGKTSLMPVAKRCFKEFSADGAKIIIDPAMADNGKLYGGFDGKYVEAMADLIKSADVILPNFTEACLLAGESYEEAPTMDRMCKICAKLHNSTGATVVLTGAEKDGKIGEIIYDGKNFSYVWDRKLPVRFHGTGDIFAAVFTAVYLNTGDIDAACAEAGAFIIGCIENTDAEKHFYGVNFEKALSEK